MRATARHHLWKESDSFWKSKLRPSDAEREQEFNDYRRLFLNDEFVRELRRDDTQYQEDNLVHKSLDTEYHLEDGDWVDDVSVPIATFHKRQKKGINGVADKRRVTYNSWLLRKEKVEETTRERLKVKTEREQQKRRELDSEGAYRRWLEKKILVDKSRTLEDKRRAEQMRMETEQRLQSKEVRDARYLARLAEEKRRERERREKERELDEQNIRKAVDAIDAEEQLRKKNENAFQLWLANKKDRQLIERQAKAKLNRAADKTELKRYFNDNGERVHPTMFASSFVKKLKNH